MGRHCHAFLQDLVAGFDAAAGLTDAGERTRQGLLALEHILHAGLWPTLGRDRQRRAGQLAALAGVSSWLAQMTGDRAGTIAALDRLIASGTAAHQISEADKARYLANQGEFLFQAGDYQRAERALAQAVAACSAAPVEAARKVSHFVPWRSTLTSARRCWMA